jgi:hypothetical protein
MKTDNFKTTDTPFERIRKLENSFKDILDKIKAIEKGLNKLIVDKTNLNKYISTKDAAKMLEEKARKNHSHTNETDSYTVAETLASAYQVVAVNSSGQIINADNTDTGQVDKIAGIALRAAAVGEKIFVRKSGKIQYGSWNWTVGNGIFFNSEGALTQDVPASGFLQRVAEPITSTSIDVSLSVPLILV